MLRRFVLDVAHAGLTEYPETGRDLTLERPEQLGRDLDAFLEAQ